MSLRAEPIGPVPEETVRVARAAFPKGNIYVRLRDELGTIFTDADFASLYPADGQPAASPWRLALVLILQHAEDLSDRQAADAVRSRIDWKYLLGLELEDTGFDFSVLSEFRGRVIEGGAEARLLDLLLERCKDIKLLKARGSQRTDSTHVLSAAIELNRLECVEEALRLTLNTLAVAAPDWLRANALPEWVERYGARSEFASFQKTKTKKALRAEEIGRDGYHLLELLASAGAPPSLCHIRCVETMRRIWVQQFYISEGRVCWRTEEEGLPPGSLWINTPHDPEARLSCKRTTSWVGYKVHLTESCDDDQPHLITHVETDNATAAENDAIEKVHQALEERELLPATHLVDSGYVDAKQLIRSKGDFGVDLLGPPKADPSWQAKAGEGFAASDFKIDWQRQQATCPAGHVSQRWNPVRGRYKEPVISVAFSARDCASCAHRQKCTRARVRNLTLRPKEQYMALLEARQRESEKDFQTTYSRRAGIEGTISQSVRRMHLRRSRYIGLAKTHLQHVLTALALNLVRLGAWFHGNTPEATRKTAFKRLMSEPAYA